MIFFNLYIGSQQLKLYQKGVINTRRRLSLKTINDALSKNTDADTYKILKNIKFLYVIYLVVFYITVLLVCIKIYFAAK